MTKRVCFRHDKEEREKFNRANLPQNCGKLLEGRRLLVELVYEMGGESTAVAWTAVQSYYQNKYNKPLTKQVGGGDLMRVVEMI